MSLIRCSDNESYQREIPSFIEPRPPLVPNPFMRPRPQKGTNLLDLYEEESEILEPEVVQVYLRLRPCKMRNLYEIKSDRDLILPDTSIMGCGRRSQSKVYSFTHVFGPDCTQQEIFENVAKDNLKKLPNGHNFTLLMYGASGSGKTYTLMGSVSAPGLIPRSLEYLFKLVDAQQMPAVKPTDNGLQRLSHIEQNYEIKWIKKLRNKSEPAIVNYRRASINLTHDLTVSNMDVSSRTNFYIWVSFVEIYNEAIYDLLVPNKKTKLQIREDSSGNVFVKGASQAFVRSAEEAFDVLVAGKHNLVVAATGIHAHSSRSHCIFTITMVIETEDEVRRACVRLCDLAGCERARATHNTGTRLQESRAINTSLHVLERCLHALRRNQASSAPAVVPYRESKLTRLLGPGLSGARTESISMVMAVNPAPQYAHESRHVLGLAGVARTIQVNNTTFGLTTLESSQDTTVDTSLDLMRLRAENERLHFELIQAHKHNEELSAEMDEKQESMSKLMNELVKNTREADERFYEAQLATLRAQIDELTEEYESRLAEVSESSSTPTELLQKKVEEYRTEIVEYKVEVAELKSQLAALQFENESLRGLIEVKKEKDCEDNITSTEKGHDSEQESDVTNNRDIIILEESIDSIDLDESLEPFNTKIRLSYIGLSQKAAIIDTKLRDFESKNSDEEISSDDDYCTETDNIKTANNSLGQVNNDEHVKISHKDDKSSNIDEDYCTESDILNSTHDHDEKNESNHIKTSHENLSNIDQGHCTKTGTINNTNDHDQTNTDEQVKTLHEVEYLSNIDQKYFTMADNMNTANDYTKMGNSEYDKITYNDKKLRNIDKEYCIKTDKINTNNDEMNMNKHLKTSLEVKNSNNIAQEYFTKIDKTNNTNNFDELNNVKQPESVLKDTNSSNMYNEVKGSFEIDVKSNEELSGDCNAISNGKELGTDDIILRKVNLLRGTYCVKENEQSESKIYEKVDNVDSIHKKNNRLDKSHIDQFCYKISEQIQEKSEKVVNKTVHSMKTSQSEHDSSLRQFEKLEMASKELEDPNPETYQFASIRLVKPKKNYFHDISCKYDKPFFKENGLCVKNIQSIVANATKNDNDILIDNHCKMNEKSKYFETNTAIIEAVNTDNHPIVEKCGSRDIDEHIKKDHNIYKDEYSRKMNLISHKTSKNVDGADTTKTHISQTDDNYAHNKEKSQYFAEEVEKNILCDMNKAIHFKGKRTYFDNIDINNQSESTKKAINHNEVSINYERSSSHIDKKTDLCNSSAVETLIGDSLPKLDVIPSVCKTILPKKYDSVDMFEGFDSPHFKNKVNLINIDDAYTSTEKRVLSLDDVSPEINSDVREAEIKLPLANETCVDTASINESKCIQTAPIGDNTNELFENIYKDVSESRLTEFELLVSQNNINTDEINSNPKEPTDEEGDMKGIRRSNEQSVDNINEKPQSNTEECKYNLRRKPHCSEDLTTKLTKRNLRLRRQKPINDEPVEFLMAQDLQKQFSDITLNVPVAEKETVVNDIPSPDKSQNEENIPPMMGIQSCPSKSVTRSRRKLFTPRAEPLEESHAETVGTSGEHERVRVLRPSYHRSVRTRRKLN